MQVPPEVSAVHVGGRRAHEIFRSGGVPDIEPRPIFIESIRRSGDLSESREVELLIRCGKGTYIRALARDIGRRLGCRAHIVSLRREAVGPFAAKNALSLDEGFESRDDVGAAILPIDFLGGFLPRYAVSEDDERLLSAGREIPLSRAKRETHGKCCQDSIIFTSGSSLITVGDLKSSDGITVIKPQINIEKIHSPRRHPN
jgi:tRNA U55 pseudouridine synthase TruB